MKTAVISYSLTGNNNDVASRLAAAFGAEHIRITEPKQRTMGTIVLDMIFNRTPKITLSPEVDLDQYDVKLFVGPVWMGHVASPFRHCFKSLNGKVGRYAFIAISGGADGPNPKLASDLKKRLGTEPVDLIDLHKASLLPPQPKPTRDVTMVYRINDREAKQLTDTVIAKLKGIVYV
jgi:hypothetical protein